MVIAVFGSHSPTPESITYELAQRLGKRLAEAGFSIATGGYGGTMEAASRGAYMAGGDVIGVTCDRIANLRNEGPNKWVKQVVHFETLSERLIYLVTENTGMVVLPGGIGTLSEFALAWSLIQVGEVNFKPLVFLGEHWRSLVTEFTTRDFVDGDTSKLIHFASDSRSAVDLLKQRLLTDD